MATVLHPSLATKPSLTGGLVRPWHVLCIFVAALFVGYAVSNALTRGETTAFRPVARDMAMQLVYSTVIFAFVVIIPEFRRCLGALFSPHDFARSRRALALAFAVMLCWGYGVYRLALFPLLLKYPSASHVLGVREALEPFEPRYVLYLLGTVVVAPVAEELLFRGYLLNLWMARWGVWPAVVASSLVFGLLHMEKSVFAAGLGVVVALVYLRYDSLWPGIVLHAAYNVLSFPWILGQFFFIKRRADIAHLSAWAPELILALLFVPLSIMFWRRFAPRAG